MTSPLRDRFGIVQRLEFYQIPDLQHIVSRSARHMGLEMSDEGALEVSPPFTRHAAYCQPSAAPGA
ncbi:Holliday junction DNA helicase RuvB [Klebsiella pneumoniae subsp. ozaenae]|uniref:Holliday junction DNA helicase RuvB n=1 Tax=Klebsiella pneumoniae subsp. ozaenae TaxID=574 RepID=A0A377ZF55_KLEPO|nr:Holliday junction DNA helicase RuvB [Klebsiella pneumoniae subsp. ozaenae]